jgi:hypothetical protein
MSYQPICLITEWLPAVAAYRAAGGMDFYWQADEPPDLDTPTLPYTIERDFFGGWAFQEAAWFYQSLRPHLPAPVLQPTDAFLKMIYPEACDGEYINDLATDANVEPGTEDHMRYAMRPSTVTQAVTLSTIVPWTQIETIGDGAADQLPTNEKYMPDVGYFHTVVDFHQRWLREAAETNRGIIILTSY